MYFVCTHLEECIVHCLANRNTMDLVTSSHNSYSAIRCASLDSKPQASIQRSVVGSRMQYLKFEHNSFFEYIISLISFILRKLSSGGLGIKGSIMCLN